LQTRLGIQGVWQHGTTALAIIQFSTDAFDINHMNLNAPFGGRWVTAHVDAAPVIKQATQETIGQTVFTLPKHDLHVTTQVQFANSAFTMEAVAGHGFTFDTAGKMLSGTISVLFGPGSFRTGVSVVGLNLDAAEFLAAAKTPSNLDDAQMMLRAFAGNDQAYGSFDADVFDMGAGKDRVFANDGNDKVSGGDGNDWIDSEFGDDSVYGGAGNDLLINGRGSDQMFGGPGNDSLMGMNFGIEGTETMTGGLGFDRFVFQSRLGQTVITDFADGKDRLALQNVVATWRDLTLTQEGKDTRISDGSGFIVLKNMNVANLSAKDFVMGGDLVYHAEIAFMTGWDYLA